MYARGGLRDEPLSDQQQRFGSASLESVERHMDALAAEPLVDGTRRRQPCHPLRARGAAVMARPDRRDGARAQPPAARARIGAARGGEECVATTGRSPVALLAAEGVLSPSVTLIHATHLDERDLDLIGRSAAAVCVCPTTEGDLGDGVPRTAELHARGVRLSIGSDSHAVVDPFAELRSLEYQARAAGGARCILADPAGEVAPVLLESIGHANGYAALHLPTDERDAVLLDADARALRVHRLPYAHGGHGGREETADDAARAAEASRRAAVITAGHPGLVSRVRVLGEEVVVDGRHVAR